MKQQRQSTKSSKGKTMAKKEQPREETTNATMEEVPFTLGQVDKKLSAEAVEIDPFESIPTVVPGKPGFETGRTIAGFFVRTKRVVSDTFTAGKIDPDTGETYRDLHILRDTASNQMFGIWSVGQLGAAMKGLEAGDYIEIENKGLAEKPLKKGQNPPHLFGFRARGHNGRKVFFDWDMINKSDDGVMEHMPARTQEAPASMRQ